MYAKTVFQWRPNRGGTRQKEDLTALIDWCQITVKGVDVFIIIEDILRIPLSFMELHGKEKGISVGNNNGNNYNEFADDYWLDDEE